MRPFLLSLAAISLTASALIPRSPATADDLYKWTDDKGRVHYSSSPPPESTKKAVSIDSRKLSSINALPNDPHKDRAEGREPADDSGSASWAPAAPANSKNSVTANPPALVSPSLRVPRNTPTAPARPSTESARPPVLIPASLLPPSNPPAIAKSEQPAQPDIVEVVAQGMGTDANAALLNAYSNAVQQALGSYVDAETLVQNDQIVRDKILTYSKGFIEKVDIVSQNQANGLFEVKIRAKVKRQQLLEQARTNNITVKAMEGVSLHAQVESQLRQEKDAKALLEKALLPLMGTTFHRAELVPPTQEQPNPTIDKKGTDDNFVTLDYKVYLWIDEQEYYKYLENNLVPVFDQIANRKQDVTTKYIIKTYSLKDGTGHEYKKTDYHEEHPSSYIKQGKENERAVSILYWKDKTFTFGKFKVYFIPEELVPKGLIKVYWLGQLEIELSLLDENGIPVALGTLEPRENFFGNDVSHFSLSKNSYCINIRPYFFAWDLVVPPKSYYHTLEIKAAKEDLPRIKKSKLEIKTKN